MPLHQLALFAADRVKWARDGHSLPPPPPYYRKAPRGRNSIYYYPATYPQEVVAAVAVHLDVHLEEEEGELKPSRCRHRHEAPGGVGVGRRPSGAEQLARLTRVRPVTACATTHVTRRAAILYDDVTRPSCITTSPSGRPFCTMICAHYYRSYLKIRHNCNDALLTNFSHLLLMAWAGILVLTNLLIFATTIFADLRKPRLCLSPNMGVTKTYKLRTTLWGSAYTVRLTRNAIGEFEARF